MATILYVSSFGSDDPTRASIPFVAAMGAVEAGHQPQIALLGEATFLLKDYIADLVAGVGLAPIPFKYGKVPVDVHRWLPGTECVVGVPGQRLVHPLAPTARPRHREMSHMAWEGGNAPGVSA
jgi:hypothetical protein